MQHSSKSKPASKVTPRKADNTIEEDDGCDSCNERMKNAHYTSGNDEQELQRSAPFDQKDAQLQEEVHNQLQEDVKNRYTKSKTQKTQKNPDLSSYTKKYDEEEMNLYDKSLRIEKSTKNKIRKEPKQRDSRSYLLEEVDNEESAQKASGISSGLGSYAPIPGAPVVLQMDDQIVETAGRPSRHMDLEARKRALFIGRKSNSQNQVRNEVLKEEIKQTRFENEQQIFNIDLNDFQDFSPEGQNKKGDRLKFDNKVSTYLKEQIMQAKMGDADFAADSIGSFLHPDEFEQLGAQPAFADHFGGQRKQDFAEAQGLRPQDLQRQCGSIFRSRLAEFGIEVPKEESDICRIEEQAKESPSLQYVDVDRRGTARLFEDPKESEGNAILL